MSVTRSLFALFVVGGMKDALASDGGYGDYSGAYDGGYDGGYSLDDPTPPPTAPPTKQVPVYPTPTAPTPTAPAPTAPTPTAADTPAPTEAPPTVEVTVTIAIDDISDFSEEQYLTALQEQYGEDATVEIIGKVITVKYDSVAFNPTITVEQCISSMAGHLGAAEDNIDCVITENSRRLLELEEAARDTNDINAVFQLEAEKRHLQAGGCTADVSIEYTDLTAANAAKTALDGNGTAAALVSQLDQLFGVTVTVSPGVTSATIQIITRVTSTSSAPVLDISNNTAALSALNNFITGIGGTVESVSSVVQTPAPTPTPPTAPTAPTPTPPTAPTAPTGAPTAAGEQEQDSTCAMGANALVLAAATFALLELSHVIPS